MKWVIIDCLRVIIFWDESDKTSIYTGEVKVSRSKVITKIDEVLCDKMPTFLNKNPPLNPSRLGA